MNSDTPQTQPSANTGARKVVVSGSSGLIGSELCAALHNRGDMVIRLVRPDSSPPADESSGVATIPWNPDRDVLDSDPSGSPFEGVDAVVHLGGTNIAEGRWNRSRKQRIRESRVRSTTLLARTIAAASPRPQTFICASGIHYYGDRGDEPVDESAEAGTGFLPEVCREWESASNPAREAGVRVAHLRFGMVVSARGGALAKMLLPFRLGLGGRVGSGRQYWSWIALEDAVRAIIHVIEQDDLSGPINVVTPEAPTNIEFTRALGKALRRPTIAPLPAFVARLVLGEMAETLLLSSVRAVPKRLVESGFQFTRPDIELALHQTIAELYEKS